MISIGQLVFLCTIIRCSMILWYSSQSGKSMVKFKNQSIVCNTIFSKKYIFNVFMSSDTCKSIFKQLHILFFVFNFKIYFNIHTMKINNELFAKIKLYSSLYMDATLLLFTLIMQATLFMNRTVLVNVNAT